MALHAGIIVIAILVGAGTILVVIDTLTEYSIHRYINKLFNVCTVQTVCYGGFQRGHYQLNVTGFKFDHLPANHSSIAFSHPSHRRGIFTDVNMFPDGNERFHMRLNYVQGIIGDDHGGATGPLEFRRPEADGIHHILVIITSEKYHQFSNSLHFNPPILPDQMIPGAERTAYWPYGKYCHHRSCIITHGTVTIRVLDTKIITKQVDCPIPTGRCAPI